MKWRLAMNSEQEMWEHNRPAGANMLQIGVAVYFVELWPAIVLGAQMPHPLPHLLALLLVTGHLTVPLAPRLARLLLKPLCLAANAPPRHLADSIAPAEVRIPGAPGTPGAALARAPDTSRALP